MEVLNPQNSAPWGSRQAMSGSTYLGVSLNSIRDRSMCDGKSVVRRRSAHGGELSPASIETCHTLKAKNTAQEDEGDL